MDDCDMQVDSPPAAASKLASSFRTSNNIMELNMNLYKTFSQVYPRDVSLFIISGDPIQLTIECDYKTLSITGQNHRVFISGICNTVNIGGTGHSIEFHGYTNQVNVLGSDITLLGNQFSHSVHISNGNIKTTGVSPGKLDFDSNMKDGQRHRFTWRPAENSASNGDWEVWEKF